MKELDKIYLDIDNLNRSSMIISKLNITHSYSNMWNCDMYKFDPKAWKSDVIYKKIMALVSNSSFDGVFNSKRISNTQFKQIKEICNCFNVTIISQPIFTNYFVESSHVFSRSIQAGTCTNYKEVINDIKSHGKDMYYFYWVKKYSFRYARVKDDVRNKIKIGDIRMMKLDKLKKEYSQ